MANSAASKSGIASVWTVMPLQISASPTAPTVMIAISAPFTQRMMTALSRWSANCPDSADNRKKGRMNRPVASALNQVSDFSSLYTWYTTNSTIAFLNRLSLNAPSNWVTKSGRKRRLFRSLSEACMYGGSSFP